VKRCWKKGGRVGGEGVGRCGGEEVLEEGGRGGEEVLEEGRFGGKGVGRRERDLEVKRCWKKGGSEEKGVRNLREIHHDCLWGRKVLKRKEDKDDCQPTCHVRLQSTIPLSLHLMLGPHI